MSETNTPQLSDKEMEEIVERAVAPSAAPASSDSAGAPGVGSGGAPDAGESAAGPGLVVRGGEQ